MEVCALADGAWYDVSVRNCSFVWAKGQPCVRIKLKCVWLLLFALVEYALTGTLATMTASSSN